MAERSSVLSSTVQGMHRETGIRRTALSLLTSSLIQGVVLVAWVVSPLLAVQGLPEPVTSLKPPSYIAVVEPPPARRESHPNPTAPAYLSSSFVARVATPQEIPVEVPDFGIENDTILEIGIDGGDTSNRGHATNPLPAPPTDVTPQQAVRPGGRIRPPSKVHHVDPVYPPLALAARVEGIVLLEAVIDEAGRVQKLRVLRSIPLLDGSAMDAVRQWRYEPTLLNGSPVPIIMTVTVTYRLSSR